LCASYDQRRGARTAKNLPVSNPLSRAHASAHLAESHVSGDDSGGDPAEQTGVVSIRVQGPRETKRVIETTDCLRPHDRFKSAKIALMFSRL
jgi:hypothetical protein